MRKTTNEIQEKIFANGGPFEAISRTTPEAAERIKKELQYIDNYYLSAAGNYCARMGLYSLEWFYDLAEDLKLDITSLSCFQYYAASEFYSIEWVEHDLIIAFKPTIKLYNNNMDLQNGCNVSYKTI